MSIRIAAYANGDDALVAWLPDIPIPSCLGFALYRRRNGKEEVVENSIGWETLVPPPPSGTHKPSTVWPIQRFYWSDYMAQHGDKVQYRVVPMIGTPDNLTEAKTMASDWTPAMLLSAGNPSGIEAYFNRGVVMSQAVTRRLAQTKGKAAIPTLKASIAVPGNETRTFLYGELGRALIDALTDGAKKGYSIYAAIFELDDPELIAAIKSYGKRAHLILANGAHKSASDDENAVVRKALKGKIDLHDRLLPSGHLGHNKFCVFVDKAGRPVKVWMGSQNWTKTGLCTQGNNCLMIHDVQIATEYRDQWDNLLKAKSAMTPDLLASNGKSHKFGVDGGKATLWFAPTQAMADLDFARKFIDQAKSAILFLMFNPGPRESSLLSAVLKRVNDPAKPSIHLVGVINQDPSSTKTTVVDLFTGKQTQAGNQSVIMPQGLDDKVTKQWIKEITRGQFLGKGGVGHAIVHSKVIVIDPWGDHPVVMTGSHNLGETASSKNDENLLIVENDHALAEAYVVNIASIHNAYRWRFARMDHANAVKYHGLHATADWQKPYFEFEDLKRAAMFWVGDAKPVAKSKSKKKSVGQGQAATP